MKTRRYFVSGMAILVMTLAVSCGRTAPRLFRTTKIHGATVTANQPLITRTSPVVAAVSGSLALDFVDATHGWFIEPGVGTVFLTSDGGRTWSASSAGTPPIYAIAMLDERIGWAVGRDELLHTTDGGYHWRVVSEPKDVFVGGIDFVTPTAGWLWTQGGRLFATRDGGRVWRAVSTPTPVNGVCATAGGPLWMAGSDGGVYLSIDNGVLWTVALTYSHVPSEVPARPTPDSFGPETMSCSGTSAWVLYVFLHGAGEQGYTYESSTDGGRLWSTPIETGPSSRVGGPEVAPGGFGETDPTTAWFFGGVGPDGAVEVLTTMNAGSSFQDHWVIPRGLTTPPSKIQTYPFADGVFEVGTFLDAVKGWAVIDQFHPRNPTYVLLATTNGGATWRTRNRSLP